jgi:hypothetical protein
MSSSFSFSVSDDLSGTFDIYTNANVLDRPGPQTFCDLFLDVLEVVGDRIPVEDAMPRPRVSTEYTDPGGDLTAGPLAASDWLRPAP